MSGPKVYAPNVVRIDHDHHAIDIVDKINEALKSRGLEFKDVSEEGADFCLFELVESDKTGVM